LQEIPISLAVLRTGVPYHYYGSNSIPEEEEEPTLTTNNSFEIRILSTTCKSLIHFVGGQPSTGHTKEGNDHRQTGQR
jgi:hypothetical protein